MRPLVAATAAAGAMLALSSTLGHTAQTVRVTDAQQLKAAVEGASRGDVIVLAPGTYVVNENLDCTAAGTSDQPIVVRAEVPLQSLIRFNAIEGFHVRAPHWTFQGLDIEGVCADHSQCEHAYHIVGAADYTTIRGNRLHEYNAAIKGNGLDGPSGARIFPDDVLIENSEFFNSTPRNTGNPVTPIDVVGGRRWTIRANFIHDHAKAGGNNISYAAFLKGNSRDGLFERNLVICELLHRGQIRLGLSFGGGGSGPPPICEDGTCTPEHQNGMMRNNIIVNCPADVGIYLNAAANSRVYNNTVYNTTGIDVRFPASIVDLRNNLLSGRIRNRDGGTSALGSNLQQVSHANFSRWFTDPANSDFSLRDGGAIVDRGENLADVPDDFCANDRDDARADIGAVEYDRDAACDTRRPHIPPVATATGGPTTPPLPTRTATATASVPHASPTIGPATATRPTGDVFIWLPLTTNRY
jgi:hypothetical protein